MTAPNLTRPELRHMARVVIALVMLGALVLLSDRLVTGPVRKYIGL